MVVWTTPKTWTSEPLTSSDLNAQLRDNLEYLHARPSDIEVLAGRGNYATTSATFVDVDATYFALSVTTTGGALLIGCNVLLRLASTAAGSRIVALNLLIDGALAAANDGITGIYTSGTQTLETPVSFTWLTPALSAGAHTIKLQWKLSSSTSATCILRGGSGVADTDWNPHFWAKEI